MATASGAIPPGAPNDDGAATAVIAAWRAGPEAGRVLVVAGVVVLAAAGSWLGVAAVTVVVALALALVVLTAAALVDVAEHRLPNALVLLAAVPVTTVAALSAATGDHAGRGAVVGAVLCGAPLLVTHLVSPAGLGFGDVKAATVVGGALGLIAPVVAVTALLLGFAIAAIGALATGRRAVALGPGLVGGSAAALASARLIGVAPW